MKTAQILLLFILSVTACSKGKSPEPDQPESHDSQYKTTLIVATVNIRYENAEDDANGHSWVSRLPMIAGMVTKYEYDIFGTQEGTGNQIAGLQSALPGYAHFGISRDNNEAGEHVSIYYKKDRFEIEQSGDFWLSETPDIPSISWDAKFQMNTTWGRFRDKSSGYTFYVFNTHFDPLGITARIESSKVMLHKAAEIAGTLPYIMTGDFNSTQTSEAYSVLKNSGTVRDAFDIAQAKSTYSTGTTFNNWQLNPTGTDRLDHIFVSSDFSVKTHSVLRDSYDKKLPSDHFPVLVQLNGK